MNNNEGALLIRIGSDIYTVVKTPETHDNVLYKLVPVDMEGYEQILKAAAGSSGVPN